MFLVHYLLTLSILFLNNNPVNANYYSNYYYSGTYFSSGYMWYVLAPVMIVFILVCLCCRKERYQKVKMHVLGIIHRRPHPVAECHQEESNDNEKLEYATYSIGDNTDPVYPVATAISVHPEETKVSA